MVVLLLNAVAIGSTMMVPSSAVVVLGSVVLPLLCPACGGSMKILAFLTDPPVVSAILAHLDLPNKPCGVPKPSRSNRERGAS
jgi:hypothetical protein